MAMFIDIVEVERFAREEAEFEWQLKALQTKRSFNKYSLAGDVSPWTSTFSDEARATFAKMRKEAFKRNRDLLREVEVESAKLRSRACFCPTELHLAKLRRKYEAELANYHSSMRRGLFMEIILCKGEVRESFIENNLLHNPMKQIYNNYQYRYRVKAITLQTTELPSDYITAAVMRCLKNPLTMKYIQLRE